MNRKQRRDAAKRRQRNDPNQIMSDQVSLFGKLPDACSSCQKSFDKKDRSMVFSWSVVVKQETVRLFCPECIEKTKEVLGVQDERKEENSFSDSEA